MLLLLLQSSIHAPKSPSFSCITYDIEPRRLLSPRVLYHLCPPVVCPSVCSSVLVHLSVCLFVSVLSGSCPRLPRGLCPGLPAWPICRNMSSSLQFIPLVLVLLFQLFFLSSSPSPSSSSHPLSCSLSSSSSSSSTPPYHLRFLLTRVSTSSSFSSFHHILCHFSSPHVYLHLFPYTSPSPLCACTLLPSYLPPLLFLLILIPFSFSSFKSSSSSPLPIPILFLLMSAP